MFINLKFYCFLLSLVVDEAFLYFFFVHYHSQKNKKCFPFVQNQEEKNKSSTKTIKKKTMGSTTSTPDDIPPTRNAQDSTYFKSHNESQNTSTRNEPLDLQTLLQSYGQLYAGYLESIRRHFATNTHTCSSTSISLLPVPRNKAASEKIEKKVTVQFKLTNGGVNKILNAVAKSGRFHDDHKIVVVVHNVKIPDNMRTQIYDTCCHEAKTESGAVDFRTMEECAFPTCFNKLTASYTQFQKGFGVMGTHTTTVELDDSRGDVEFAVIA